MRKNVKRTFLTEIVGKPDLGQVNGSPAFSAVYRWYRESLEPCCWRFYASKSLKWTEIWHSDSRFWQFTGEQSDSEISTMRRNQQNSCKPHQVEYKIHVKKNFQNSKLNFREIAYFSRWKGKYSRFVCTEIDTKFSLSVFGTWKFFFTWIYPISTPDFKEFIQLLLSLEISLSLCSQ